MSPDPLGGSIGDPQTQNLYSYVANRPLESIDPSGLCVHTLFDDANCYDGNEGGGPAPGPRMSCFVDGVASDCGETLRLVDLGWAAVCPASGCLGLRFGADNQFHKWAEVATAVLSTRLSGCEPSDEVEGIASTCNGATIVMLTFHHFVDVAIGQTDNSGNSSWAWTFTKTFFSNLVSKKFYKEELGEGGCLAAFGEGFEKADILAPVLNGSPGFAETAIKGQAATLAARYAANQGLTVPLRSSVVRGILEKGETGAGAFAIGYFDVQAAWGVGKELQAAASGACH
jgi:hypothetical protein